MFAVTLGVTEHRVQESNVGLVYESVSVYTRPFSRALVYKMYS